MVGGWMPAVLKVFPVSAASYIELIVFGDVEAKDKFIVQTWHRSALIEDGRISKLVYGYSYPAFPPARFDPPPEQFYRPLLRFPGYWDDQLHAVTPAVLRAHSAVPMSNTAVANAKV